MPRALAVVLVGLFAAYAVALELAAEFVLVPPPAVHDMWYGPTPIVVGLTVAALVGGLVRHPAVAVVAFVPVAIQGALDAGGYERPWHEIAPTVNPGWPLSLSLVAAVALGLVAGRAVTPRAENRATASQPSV